MIYMDTSSLLKLVLADVHSEATRIAIVREEGVIVSKLAELEALVQFRALRLSGTVRKAHALKLRSRLEETMDCAPFIKRHLPATIFAAALRQQEASFIHCRSLDRIHLAAMAELGIKRLMTHDERQSKAAKECGYKVVMPGIR